MELVAVADPGDPQLRQPGGRGTAGPGQDVDGASAGGRDHGRRGLLVQRAEGVHAVRARLQVQPHPPCGLGPPLPRRRLRPYQDVGTGVDHQIRIGRADGGEEGRLLPGVHETARARIDVLQVAADGPGGGQPLGELRRAEPVAPLHVRRHRDPGRAHDAGDRGQHLRHRHDLPVGVAEGRRDGRAAGGDGGESGVGHHTRGGGVPDVGQDQRTAGDVQCAQAGCERRGGGVCGAHGLNRRQAAALPPGPIAGRLGRPLRRAGGRRVRPAGVCRKLER